MLLKSFYLFFVLIFTAKADKLTYLVDSLIKLCGPDQNNTISLYQCEQKLIEVDKKKGTYIEGSNYNHQTFYMMQKFDHNKDGRMSKNQLFNMGAKIMDGDFIQSQVQNYWKAKHPQENIQHKQQTQKANQDL